jgi:hypothetical protein
VLLQIVQVLPKLALRVVQQLLLVLCYLVAFSAFYPVDVETALSVYFHMYVKNNNGYLYDSVLSINLVCSYLKYGVIFPTDFDLKRFLIDDEYIPTDLPVNWELHTKLIDNTESV